MSDLTLQSLRELADLMRKHAMLPRVVKTKKEAQELTRNDPCGHKWQVGEEYYRAETLSKTMPIKVER